MLLPMLLRLAVLEATAATTSATATAPAAWLSICPNLIVGLELPIWRTVRCLVALIGVAGL